MYSILVNILMDLIIKYVPNTRYNIGYCKPKWMTNEVKKQIDAKTKAWKRLKARKTSRRAEEYRRIRNMTTSVVNQAKKIFIKKLCEDIKVNPKCSWSYVRSKTSIKDNVLRVRNRSGDLTKSDKETANIMNNAFQSVFIQENDRNIRGRYRL